jgi:secreted PhoX family phosphatase
MKDNDSMSNRSANQTFQDVVEARLSRRGFLGGGLATAAALSLGGVGALLKAVPASAKTHQGPLLGFEGIPV